MYHENRLFFPSELQINQSISPLFDRSPLHSTSSFFTPLLMLLIHLSKLQISQKILLDHVGEIYNTAFFIYTKKLKGQYKGKRSALLRDGGDPTETQKKIGNNEN